MWASSNQRTRDPHTMKIDEMVEALLKDLVPLPGRISKLLKTGYVTDSHERHSWVVMEIELSAIITALRMLPPSGDCLGACHPTPDWLARLRMIATEIMHIGDDGEPCYVLQRRPMPSWWSYRSNLRDEIWQMAYKLQSRTECLIYYNAPELVPPLQPQMAENKVGGLHVHDHLVVGIDNPVEDLLRWLTDADKKSLQVMAIVGTAGVGKTTLAMELHCRLWCQTEQYFQCCAVANFSQLISGAIDQVAIPLDKFAYLVLLDLHGWENLKDEDLLKICKMCMLRYLSVKRTGVTKLPPQIKELRILRTLDISHTHISELPPEVCELMDLQMLDLRGTLISQLPDQIKRLNYFRTLLIGGEGIINSDETLLVTRISQSLMTAVHLHTVATVDFSACPASLVEALGELKHLQVLAITWSFHQCTDRAYQKSLLWSITDWSCLESLTIHCGLGCS